MNVRYLVAAVLVMCTAGCGYRIKATTNVNPTVDVSSYSSFFMIKGNSTGDAAVDDRLMSSVQAALLDKGWIDTPQGEARAAVIIHAATATSHTDQSFYDGWGGWNWRLAGSSGAATGDYKVGTVVVTIFDARTKQAIWRGFAPDAPSNREKGSATDDKAIARIFDSFPDRPVSFNPTDTTIGASPAAPVIIFSAAPSLLVLIDGDPVYRAVPGTDLERLVNTKPLIVRDRAGMCYLKILDGWMQAYSLESSWWTVSGVPPEGGPVALGQAIASNTVDLLRTVAAARPAGTRRLSDESAPTIVVAQAPAQLIVTDGPMVFAAIEGTALQYVVNTSADVFREPTDQQLYVLISGQWFRSWRPEGPWQAVAGSELPGDFARIPDGSPKAAVKASLTAPRR